MHNSIKYTDILRLKIKEYLTTKSQFYQQQKNNEVSSLSCVENL